MEPNLAQQVEILQRRVEQLEQIRRTDNIENIDDQLILDVIDVTDSKITRVESDSVGTEGGTVEINTLEYPDKWLLRRYKGQVYLIPAYTLDRK